MPFRGVDKVEIGEMVIKGEKISASLRNEEQSGGATMQ
jgi:hypothetical protein